MRRGISGIDHVVIAVRDLERARATYARLGFRLTPRGHHTLGSQNHCIMFGADYIELLAAPKPHPALEPFRAFLASGDGLAALAFASPNADAAFAELSAAGIAAQAPLEFSRPVALAQGSREARFRIVQLPAAATPGCRAFLCQHYTRDLVWRPEYQAHPVGVLGLAAVAIVAADASAAAQRFGTLLDEAPRRIDEGLLVPAGAAALALTPRWKLGRRLDGVALPTRARPMVAALFLRVADRERAARVLRRGGFAPVRLADGAYGVNAAQAHGVTLIFG
jgi:catechol 2,3-dioxygenase-like lactoylglutathione lyase family enzyme